jgi:hypothetical protein
MPGVRWIFETMLDLGDAGNHAAVVTADVTVSWARSPEDGYNDVSVRLIKVEVYTPVYDHESKTWGEKLSDKLDGFFMSPKSVMRRQSLETHLEDEHEAEILEHLENRHVADRHEDAI